MMKMATGEGSVGNRSIILKFSYAHQDASMESTSNEGRECIYIPLYPKTSRTEDRLGVPPPQASRTTKNQSEPLSGTLPDGGSISGGHLHHPGAIHDEEGVVHPLG